MPLMIGKGKKAFEHNIKTEMHAGKPQGQSLAIAYNMARKARKKMAEGGQVPGGPGSPYVDPKKAKEFEHGASESGFQPKEWAKNLKEGLSHLAEGGMVESEFNGDKRSKNLTFGDTEGTEVGNVNEKLHPDAEEAIDHHMAMARAIMKAHGGMIEESHDSMFHDPDFLSDEENDMALDETYPDSEHKESDTAAQDDGEGILDRIMHRTRMKGMKRS